MVTTILIASYIILINIIAFVLYGIDKKLAVHHGRRIPVWVLLWTARLGGGVGSWLGMRYFHHKTKHSRFQILVPLWITIWMVFLVILLAVYGGDAKDELDLLNSKLHR